MEKKLEKYVKKVVSYSSEDSKTKQRLYDDILTQLSERARIEGVERVLASFGSPRNYAEEVLGEIVKADAQSMRYEYRSKIMIFGLPLVHVRFSSRSNHVKDNTACGIIAIAPISFGVISIGAISGGLFAFGAVSLGLLAFGALAIGLLFASGAIAIGLGAMGGIAIGFLARGAIAAGHTAIGVEGDGVNFLTMTNVPRENVFDFIKQSIPNIPDWIARLFSMGSAN